jgi:hypothetical protein
LNTGEEHPAIADGSRTETTLIVRIAFILICQYAKQNQGTGSTFFRKESILTSTKRFFVAVITSGIDIANETTSNGKRA